MKKPGRHAGQRGRNLSDEDATLWEHAAKSLAPLKRGKARVHATAETEIAERPHIAKPPSRHEDSAAKIAGSKKPHADPAHVPVKQRPAPALNVFDAKTARKVRTGRTEIDARVDLHGLRQSEAHAELRRFLISCYGRGLRLVLVITGKGMPSRNASNDIGEPLFGREERGILKRSVPTWLAEPELRAIVVSYTTASVRHGGEGALYLHLRNPERGGRKR